MRTTDGLLGSLELYEGGREQLLGRSARNAKFGFIAAAAMFVPGLLGTLLFKASPAAASASSSCESGITDTTSADCSDRVYDDQGKTYAWKITKAGVYDVHVTPPAVTLPIDPEITIKDGTGKVVTTGPGDVRQAFAPGSYSVNVRDDSKGRAASMKGGLGFALKISGTPSEEPAAPAAVASSDPKPAPTPAPQPVAAVHTDRTSPVTPNKEPATKGGHHKH